MKVISITIETPEGQQHTQLIPAIVRAGLALHKAQPHKGPGWIISHADSGLAINTNPIPRADQAREILRQLIDAGGDFSGPYQRFSRRKFRAIRSAIRVYGLR